MTCKFVVHPDMVEYVGQHMAEYYVVVQGEIVQYHDLADATRWSKPKPVSQGHPHDWYRRYDKRPKK